MGVRGGPVPARANIFYSVESTKDFMRKYLGMERESSMEAVCGPSYDISCHVQWNVHGADTSSMRTWNHMLLASKGDRCKMSATGATTQSTSGF